MTTKQRITASCEAIDRWRAAPDLTARERDILDVLEATTKELDRNYAVLYSLAPDAYRESPEVEATYQPPSGSQLPDDTPPWQGFTLPNFRDHDFNGMRFGFMFVTDHVDEADGWGFCTDRGADPFVWVHATLEGPRLVEVGVHEGLHACLGDRMGEAEVDRVARDVSSFAFRLLLSRSPKVRLAAGLEE